MGIAGAIHFEESVADITPCPVCGSADIKPVHRKSLLPDSGSEPTILAYRCEKGHTFLPAERAKSATSDCAD